MAQANKTPENQIRGFNPPGPYDPMRYSEVLQWIGDRPEAFIGSSYYYLIADDRRSSLFRLTASGGTLYSVQMVDYSSYGISEEDLEDAVRESAEEPEILNHYPINAHIEKKLRTLLDV